MSKVVGYVCLNCRHGVRPEEVSKHIKKTGHKKFDEIKSK